MIPIDFADLSLLARAVFAGVRDINLQGTESWSTTLYGVALAVYFEHAQDRWTFITDAWQIRFTFVTDLPYAADRVQFGRFGQVRDMTIRSPEAYLRQITVLKVFLSANESGIHTTGLFTVE